MPTANTYCERLIGSIRRECLDDLIPLNTSHLRRTLRDWVCHYNAGGRIALWDLALLIDSNRAHLFASKLLNYLQFHVTANRSSADCITSIDEQTPRELLDDIIAEYRYFPAPGLFSGGYLYATAALDAPARCITSKR